MTRPARAIVNLSAIKHNFRIARSQAPKAKAVAMVKANAYGHGAVEVARALSSEADAFGVACLEEAMELRDAGINKPILLLEGFFDQQELDVIDQLRLDVTIHSQYQIDQLLAHPLQRPLKVWLKIDTGMGRLGFLPDQFRAAYQQLQQPDKVAEIVLMTHLARADETQSNSTADQVALFHSLTDSLQHPISLANSPAILAWPQACVDWIRPGMMLYGASPLDKQNPVSSQLQAAMTMESAVISLKDFKAGDGIGYGAQFQCSHATKIAVVAMGYGDGYPRVATQGTPVLINGQRCPLVGRVSMDMLTVDVTDLDEVNCGDKAIFWGESLSVSEVAEHCGTNAYEMVTRLTGRAKRHYI